MWRKSNTMRSAKSVKFSSKRKIGKKCVGIREINPFDVHTNKPKHTVLGQKLKSNIGLPDVTKCKFLQERKKALLQEYKWKNKSNQFIDQRIGERNVSMTEDDKMIERFAVTRRRAFNNKSIYNLLDSDILSHRGQSLNEMEKFEDPSNDEDNDAEEGFVLTGKFVRGAHFCGGILSEGKQDRESLIRQLINESKKRKTERMHTKLEIFEDTEQLDNDWNTLGLGLTSNAMKKDDTKIKCNQFKEYDVMVRQLKFEMHAQASERTKSEEEITKENKEQLHRLQKESLKQLQQMADKHQSVDDEEYGFFYSNKNMTKTSYNSRRSDELRTSGSKDEEDSDSFYVESGITANEGDKVKEIKNIKAQLYETRNDKSESGFDVKERKGEKRVESISNNIIDCLDNEEQISKVVYESTTELSDEVGETQMDAFDNLCYLKPSTIDEQLSKIIPVGLNKKVYDNTVTNKTEKNTTTGVSVPIDLPDNINVPENYGEFKNLIKNWPAKQLGILFDIILKNLNPSLRNKKMFILAEYVIQFVNDGEAKLDTLFDLVNILGFLKEFNKEKILKKMLDILSSKLDEENIIHHKSKISKITPDMSFLLLYLMTYLKEVETEAFLPVNKAALSIASKYLSQINPHHRQCYCVIVGFYFSAILLLDSSQTCKIYPEAITFLNKFVKLSTSSKVRNQKSEDLKLLSRFNENIFFHCPKVVEGYLDTYMMKNPQSKILVAPLLNTIQQISECGSVSKADILRFQTIIEKYRCTQLLPLEKTTKRPKTLSQYEPSFNTITLAGKWNKELLTEKVKEQKLLSQLKRERKGAMRVLRKDCAFLASVKLKEQAVIDELRKRKLKEIYNSIASQEGELHSVKKKR